MGKAAELRRGAGIDAWDEVADVVVVGFGGAGACAALEAKDAGADVLLLDGLDAARNSSHMRPSRGMSMEQVEASFGMPSSQHGAVGEPPITRWDYPGFAVYFEYEFVIHAVATP